MKPSSTDRRIQIGIFLLALALRLAWVGTVQWRGGELVGPDALSYDHLATNLLAGKGMEKWDYQGLFNDPHQALIVRAFRPPGLPLLLAGIYGVAGHHFWVARLFMAVVGAATCLLVFRIARRLFGSATATLAGLITAVYPKFIYYSGDIVTETVYTFLLAGAVLTLLGAEERVSRDEGRGGAWRWALAGALLGLATLCRSVLLAFSPLAGLWALAVRRRKLRALGEAALIGAGFALVMAPWWVRNAIVLGRFIPATTEGGLTFWVTNCEGADGGGHVDYTPQRGHFEGLVEVEIDRKFYRLGWDCVTSHPGRFVRLAGAKFVRFWRLWPHASEPSVGVGPAIVAGVAFTPVLLLALWGAVAARPGTRSWRRVGRSLLLIYLLILYYTAIHMVYMAITRYRLPIEPYLIVLAAYGLVRLFEGRESRTPSPAIGNRKSEIGNIDLSVIIPTYNEEPNIRRTAEAVVAWLRGQGRTWELLLVDDGSRDGTLAIEREVAADEPRVRLLPHSPNRGKGYAVRRGMLAASGAIRLFLDADYSTPIEECEKLLPALAAGADAAIGTRRAASGAYGRASLRASLGLAPFPGALRMAKPPLHRHLLGELYVKLASWLLGTHVSDFNCGFKAFRAEAAERLFRLQCRDDWSFDAEVLALAERLGCCIKEVPVRWKHVQATSKVRPIRDGFRSLGALIKIGWDLRVRKSVSRIPYSVSRREGHGVLPAPDTKFGIRNTENRAGETSPETEGRRGDRLLPRREARRRLLRLYAGRGWTSVFCWLRYWHSNVPGIEAHLPAEGTIVDLGCGHGVLANYLALRSPRRQVIGFDLSEHRIAVARSIGLPNAEFRCQDLFDAEPIPCRAIVVADVLHHLRSCEEGDELLARCVERLPPDGLLVVKEISRRPRWKFLCTQPVDFLFYKGRVFFRSPERFSALFARLGLAAELVPLHAWRPLSHVMYVCRRRSTGIS